MKSFFAFIIVFSTALVTTTAFAAPKAEELMVNSYLNEQAARRMEQMAPRGEYTIQSPDF